MASIQINGNASEIKAEVFNDGVYVRDLPLNTLDTNLSEGGYDPVFEVTTPPDEIRVSALEGYEITGGLPASVFDPVTEQNITRWVDIGDYYSLTIKSGNNGNYTPTVQAEAPSFLNLNFGGDTANYTVQVVHALGLVLETYPTGVDVAIPNTYLGDILQIVPNPGFVVETVTNNFPFDPVEEVGLRFTDDGTGVYSATLRSHHFNDASPAYWVNATVIAGSTTVSPFNQLYLADDDVLNGLADVPMTDPSDPEINRSEYVINVLSIPFEIPAEVIGTETNVKLGNHVTDVLAPTILEDSITIDLGTIQVGGLGNSLDFESEYELVLPFIQSTITLEPSLVVGKAVSVEYVLDVYTGDVTVNVYNNVSVSPIQSIKDTVGRSIPFRMMNNVNNPLGTLSGVSNNVLTAFIRIKTPELQDGEFNNLVTKVGDLVGVKGYVEFEQIRLVSKASGNAKAQIRSLLQNGVIIK